MYRPTALGLALGEAALKDLMAGKVKPDQSTWVQRQVLEKMDNQPSVGLIQERERVSLKHSTAKKLQAKGVL